MANQNGIMIDVNMALQIGDKAVCRCLEIMDMWLQDHPDKTIVIEEENGVRVCLIADREEKHGEEQGE